MKSYLDRNGHIEALLRSALSECLPQETIDAMVSRLDGKITLAESIEAARENIKAQFSDHGAWGSSEMRNLYLKLGEAVKA
jgi:hypothetical protein